MGPVKSTFTKALSLVPLIACGFPGHAVAQTREWPQVGINQSGPGNITTAPVGAASCTSCVPMPVSGSITGGSISISGGSISVTNTVSVTGTLSATLAGGSISLIPSASSGVGIAPSVSSVTAVVLKSSAGNLYSAYVTTGTIAGFLMIFNSSVTIANATTTLGVANGNLMDCVVAPANATTAINYSPGPPEVFANGILAQFSSSGCSSLTAAVPAMIHGSAS